MKRRSVLSVGALGVVVPVSGCLSEVWGGGSDEEVVQDTDDTDVDNGDENGDPDEVEDEDVSDPPMDVSLTSVDDDLDDLAFVVEVVNETMADNQLASFDISVENITDEPVSYTGVSYPDQSFYGFDEMQDGIWLFPADKTEKQPLNEVEGCARADELWIFDIFEGTELGPGERLTNEYVIGAWKGAFNSGSQSCPEPRNYRVESEYGDHGEWGFEFDIVSQ